MELRDAVMARRMVRRFVPGRPLDPDVLDEIVSLGLRAPSAGFSQGWDFVVLDEAASMGRFWAATTEGEPDQWLRGVSSASALIVCCSDPGTYLRRYAEPDKPWADQDEAHWPVPYWDVDTGMAAMIMLLAAVDHDLGALFFGVPVERLDHVRAAFVIPDDRNIVGVIAIGHPADRGPSGSTRTRRRRPAASVIHRRTFGSATGVD